MTTSLKMRALIMKRLAFSWQWKFNWLRSSKFRIKLANSESAIYFQSSSLLTNVIAVIHRRNELGNTDEASSLEISVCNFDCKDG